MGERCAPPTPRQEQRGVQLQHHPLPPQGAAQTRPTELQERTRLFHGLRVTPPLLLRVLPDLQQLPLAPPSLTWPPANPSSLVSPPPPHLSASAPSFFSATTARPGLGQEESPAEGKGSLRWVPSSPHLQSEEGNVRAKLASRQLPVLPPL